MVLQIPLQKDEMKDMTETFPLVSTHTTPASQTVKKPPTGERRSSEDYVNVACELDEYLREHECGAR